MGRLFLCKLTLMTQERTLTRCVREIMFYSMYVVMCYWYCHGYTQKWKAPKAEGVFQKERKGRDLKDYDSVFKCNISGGENRYYKPVTVIFSTLHHFFFFLQGSSMLFQIFVCYLVCAMRVDDFIDSWYTFSKCTLCLGWCMKNRLSFLTSHTEV